MPNTSKSINIRFFLLQALLTTTECVSVSYASPILVSRGYTPLAIGRIIALASILAVCIRPVWGILNDKYAISKQTVISGVGIGTVCYYFLSTHNSVPIITICVSGLYMTIMCMLNVVDAWALKLIKEGYELNYGATRSGGSIAFAFTAILFGFVVSSYGYMPGNYMLWALFIMMLILVMGIPNPTLGKDIERGSVSLSDSVRTLCKNKIYMMMLFAFFLCTLASCSFESFFSVLLLDVGGTEKLVGASLFIQAIVEVPTMVNYKKIKKKTGFSAATLMGIACGFYAVKSLAGAFSDNPWVLIASSASQMFSYALFLPATIDFMLDTVGKKYLATANLLFYALGSGVAAAIGNFLWGNVVNIGGLHVMYRCVTVLALMASAMALYTANKQRKEEQNDILRV